MAPVGIAVGMATNIPPHNLDELIAAVRRCWPIRDVADEALLALMPGPDFPTGGVMVEPRERSWRPIARGGAFRLRARWEVEDLGRGMWQVVVTEIPYQVQKSKLIEKLAELIRPRRCRSWPMCATNPPRMCASSWSPGRGRWTRRC
jgi:topoisomerase IV subunit A